MSSGVPSDTSVIYSILPRPRPISSDAMYFILHPPRPISSDACYSILPPPRPISSDAIYSILPPPPRRPECIRGPLAKTQVSTVSLAVALTRGQHDARFTHACISELHGELTCFTTCVVVPASRDQVCTFFERYLYCVDGVGARRARERLGIRGKHRDRGPVKPHPM